MSQEAHAVLARIEVDRQRASVYEHGWQSWSPTTAYRLDERPLRPVSDARRIGNYHPERTAPQEAFWGEGLLAVDPGTGEGVHVFAAPSADGPIPAVHAELDGDRVVVSDGAAVVHTADEGGDGLDAVLARWGSRFAEAAGVGPLTPPPTVWCSWYHYFQHITQDDIAENVAAIDELGLDVDVVQIDDGYQSELGDWLALSDRFASLEKVVGDIPAAGRRAGIWVAPFLAGERSDLVREHPDWLVGGARPGRGWGEAAALTSRWRARQQGRFWVNDADCLVAGPHVAGPHVERREDWAPVVEAYSGLRSSSNRLRGLDEWGLEVTRRLLEPGLLHPLVP